MNGRRRRSSIEDGGAVQRERVLLDRHAGGEDNVARCMGPPVARRSAPSANRLRRVYGVPLAKPHGHPIAELILTVLSQSTNDRNRDVAYLALRERFPTWEEVRDAPGRRDRGGDPARRDLADQVGPDQGDPAARSRRSGELSLDWLADVAVPEAQAYLVGLPGVGRKTAACVLLFALGMRDVPGRHARLPGGHPPGHVPAQGAAFEELHDEMLGLTPPGEELELHLNLLRHGRRTCYARHPACCECVLEALCPKVGLR